MKFPVTRLDHKHHKRENYTLLAGLPFAQNLWCIAPHCVFSLIHVSPSRTFVLDDGGEAGLRDEDATSFIHEDVRLATSQSSMERRNEMHSENVPL